MSAGAPVASISWTTRPSSWTSPRRAWRPIRTSLGPCSPARERHRRVPGEERGSDGNRSGVDRRLDGRGAGLGVDHRKQLPRLRPGARGASLIPSPTSGHPSACGPRHDPRRGARRAHRRWRRPATACQERIARIDRHPGRGYGLHDRVRPRRPMRRQSAGRGGLWSSVARGGAKTGHPVAQEQVIARPHDRGQFAHGAASIEKARPSTSASRGSSGVCPRPAGRSSGTARRRDPHPGRPQSSRGPPSQTTSSRIASGQRRDDRVLLDESVILAGHHDLHRRGGRLDAPRADAPPQHRSSSSTTGTYHRPAGRGARLRFRPLALTMTVVGCEAPQPEPAAPGRIRRRGWPGGRARASTRGDGPTGRCRRRRGRRRRSRGAGP